MMLWNYLCDQMRKHPNRIIGEGEASLTYEALIVYAEVFAKKLEGQKCCAIYCKSELAAAMALLGCFAAGVTAVPLSLRYGEAHCRRILDFISPTCIITDNGGEFGICDITDSEYEEPGVHPALIMCTSGTTGTPKGVMLGYYKNPVLTSKVIREGWLCTGDIASIDANGLLKIYGRSDDMIIRAGMNIYPQEIEAELKRDNRVKDVLAYGYTDKNGRTQIGLDTTMSKWMLTSGLRKDLRLV